MTKMLFGIALVCLEMSLTLEEAFFGLQNVIIGLLPDFAGFILLIFAHREMMHENDYFYKNIKFSLWCGTVALMIYIMDLTGLTARGDFQSLLLQILLMVLKPICLFRIVRGIRQVGKDYDIDVKGKLLLGIWIAQTVLAVAGFVTAWDLMALLHSILSFAFIALVFNFKCVYEEIRPVEETEEE